MKLLLLIVCLCMLACHILCVPTTKPPGFTSEEVTLPDGSSSTLYLRDDFVHTSGASASPDPETETAVATTMTTTTAMTTPAKIVFVADSDRNFCTLLSIDVASWFPGAEVMQCRMLGRILADRHGYWKGWDWDGQYYSLARLGQCEFGINRVDARPENAYVGNRDVSDAIKFAVDPGNGCLDGSKAHIEGVFDCIALNEPRITWTLGATNWPAAATF